MLVVSKVSCPSIANSKIRVLLHAELGRQTYGGTDFSRLFLFRCSSQSKKPSSVQAMSFRSVSLFVA